MDSRRNALHRALVAHRLFIDAEILFRESGDVRELLLVEIDLAARRAELSELRFVIDVRQSRDHARLGEKPFERCLPERHLRSQKIERTDFLEAVDEPRSRAMTA